MGEVVQCFWLEPTERVRLTRRRFAPGTECPGRWGYHNASLRLGTRERRRGFGRPPTDKERADGRWPESCECGYAFGEDDEWQVNGDTIYRARDGRRMTLREAPPGAMWDATWMTEHWRGEDGRALCVKLPDGSDWLVDGPATGGGRWQRTGDPTADPPTVSATPSIAHGDPETYHGFLTDGALREV